jgi:hypothetical protein
MISQTYLPHLNSIIYIYISKKKFNRKNLAGLEHFLQNRYKQSTI